MPGCLDAPTRPPQRPVVRRLARVARLGARGAPSPLPVAGLVTDTAAARAAIVVARRLVSRPARARTLARLARLTYLLTYLLLVAAYHASLQLRSQTSPLSPLRVPTTPPMNPFGAATGLGKANASVDSANGIASALARVEVGASSSAGSSVAARSGGVAAAGLKPAAPKKGLVMRMPRAHLGTTPMKFSFQAQDLQVTLSTVGFEGRLVLAFKRGNDRRETEPMQLKEEVHH